MNRLKKFRKMYRKSIDKLAFSDLKKEILRLARIRDVLGIILIMENTAIAVFVIFRLVRGA